MHKDNPNRKTVIKKQYYKDTKYRGGPSVKEREKKILVKSLNFCRLSLESSSKYASDVNTPVLELVDKETILQCSGSDDKRPTDGNEIHGTQQNEVENKMATSDC